MRANSMCISCILSKEEQKIRAFPDEIRKSQYLHQILGLLYQYGQTESAPWLAEQIDGLYRQFWGTQIDYSAQKKRYNRLLLDLEPQIEAHIRQASDILKECIKYVCAANYIDFSAVPDVNEGTFEMLMEKAGQEGVDEKEYTAFVKDLGQADRLVYLTDNCGEIVLDKLFIKYIKERFPSLQITVIVRGEPVLNDATMEDAREVGLTDLVPCIGNGNGVPGTEIKRLSREAKELLRKADLVISKGQGNFESLYGEGVNPYYFFLCKCELFVGRFGLKKFDSVFAKEERIYGSL